MLIAQLTVFECGGSAICFCLEHRFCDLSSVVVFLKSWSGRARSRSDSSDHEIALPDFVGSSFLPPRVLLPLPAIPDQIENRIMTRLSLSSRSGSCTDSEIRHLRRPIDLRIGGVIGGFPGGELAEEDEASIAGKFDREPDLGGSDDNRGGKGRVSGAGEQVEERNDVVLSRNGAENQRRRRRE
ncbi:Transferase [Parasponia andersonii]|uniref:Transferase n=1 Tax=Parasponia andersonii TaxID=3476 RepID=A0A2P5DV33_PARAD|nr:Transferase [Parasponia andersonii]